VTRAENGAAGTAAVFGAAAIAGARNTGNHPAGVGPAG
jgi:hypothetical protein